MNARSTPKAGGFLLAVAIVAGVIVGGLLGQPSIGFLAGTALGVVILLAMFLRDRRR